MKYLTIACALLMGYSQIFTYVYLGVISTPSTGITDGIVQIHAPLHNTKLFENTLIEEVDEEIKYDREAVYTYSMAYNSVASLCLSIIGPQPLTVRTYRFSLFQYLSHSADSYIRFCVFRV